MARKMVFEASDTKPFEISYEGFMATSRPANRNEHKWADSIMTKLENISIVVDGVVQGFDPNDALSPRKRSLGETGGFVIFEDDEYEFFKRAVEAVQSAPVLSRAVNRLFSIMDDAKKGDPKELMGG